MEIPNSLTNTGPRIQSVLSPHSTSNTPSATSTDLPREAFLTPEASSRKTQQISFNKREDRNEVSNVALEYPSVPNTTIAHQNLQAINAQSAQATSFNKEQSSVALTPEQKRLQSLQQKNQSLTKTVQQLRARHLSLLHSLQHQLPSSPNIRQLHYQPSTAAHSTPSSIPKFSKGEEEAIMLHTKAIIKEHIARLHAYNEIKDVAQGLMGMVADARGVRVAELYEEGEFGVGEKD